MTRDLDEYREVVTPWIMSNGEAIKRGELIHKDHPEIQVALVRRVEVRHDVEQMTAEPGEKRDVQIRRKRAAGE